VSPERARASAAAAAAYGRSTPELLGRFDPGTCLLRTSQLCLDGELSEFSEIWPRSGLMRNGTVYQLPPLVRLTDATGSGLWPTPRSNDNDQGNDNRQAILAAGSSWKGQGRGATLHTMARLFPTPTGITNTGGAALCKWGGARSRAKLRTMVSSEELNGALNPTWVEWLMGFPLGWTVLEPSATPSSHKSRKSSDERS
jgi:hypothetical protein